MGLELLENRVCIDLFITTMNNKSIDLASFAPIASMTGGEINLFPSYNSEIVIVNKLRMVKHFIINFAELWLESQLTIV